DEPKAAVAGHAAEPELDLLGIDDMQRLDRRDRDACDAALHAANLAEEVWRKPGCAGGFPPNLLLGRLPNLDDLAAPAHAVAVELEDPEVLARDVDGDVEDRDV